MTKIPPLTDQDEATGIDAAVAASVEESLSQLGAERRISRVPAARPSGR